MVEGLKKIQKILPQLEKRIALSIGFVCAGMASRLATRTYIEKNGGVRLDDVYRICYRGNGWPGRFRVFAKDGRELMDRPLIGGSLKHVVGRDHYLRCQNCRDHWGLHADIVVSDPWAEEFIQNEKKGRSAIMVRTERGRAAVASAVENGDLIAERIAIEKMLGYNKHLLLDADHTIHSWMEIYQLLFLGRLKYLAPILNRFFQGTLVGLKTTLKALLSKKYYY